MSAHGFAQGKHLLIDLYGAKHLTDLGFIQKQLSNAALLCGATLLDTRFHEFGENQGITGVALLAESHISIHTWPENEYAAIDIFMCGQCNPELAITPLTTAFEATKVDVSAHARGSLPSTLAVSNQ